MKLQQKFRLAEGYNTPDTTIIIASFPGRKNRSIRSIDAVASYTDHFARSFRKVMGAHNKKVVVLAQKIDKEEWYTEGNMLVARVWDKGSALAFVQILTALGFFKNVKNVLVQFEFHQFGAKITTALFPAFLSLLKVSGKRITLTMHQVVDDISSLSGHVNIRAGSKRARLFNLALIEFYKLTSRLADTVVVHNKIFATKLKKITGRDDVIVIPHGLGAIPNNISKAKARKTLGMKQDEFVILYFGFLTWYKGADWIIEQIARSKNKNVRLLVAGGESPNIKDTKHYRTFLSRIYRMTKGTTNITITGFVEDTDMPVYFAASDLAVLPYRALMSSSGPFAMAVSFKKPFLISKALLPYADDKDFTDALAAARLTKRDVSFSLNPQDFRKHVRMYRTHVKRFKMLSRILRENRVWPKVAEKFYQAIHVHSLETTTRFDIMHRGTASYART